MGSLYAYSLVPVLSVAFLLFFTAALRGRNARGLAIYCLSVGVWTAALLCISIPKLAPLGERLAFELVQAADGANLHDALSRSACGRVERLLLAQRKIVGPARRGRQNRGNCYEQESANRLHARARRRRIR